nr:low specificity L-threonine aldolase [Enterovirga rhinocerotis]
MNFASDNIEGASAPVLDAVLRANAGPAPAYGADPWTARVESRFAAMFEREVAVFPVATGTVANALSIAASVSPWGSCLCHFESHVIDDECGAPEFYAHGAKLIGLPGTGCKLVAAEVAAAHDALPKAVKQMPPQALSIAQATESGLVYSVSEIAALGEVCRSRQLAFHMDGARFANALVRLGCTPAEMTWKAGIDILSFGATKNGCLAAEAVIVFDPALAASIAYRRKRAGHTFSKARFIAAQLEAYLDGDHWLANARHANAMAERLARGLLALPGVRAAWPAETNSLFAIMPEGLDRALRNAGALYHPWSARALAPEETVNPGEVLVRLVTSFATSEAKVDSLLAAARSAGGAS